MTAPPLHTHAPAAKVRHALDLYKDAGVPGSTFVGVPVFQAEGLTVTTQDTVRARAPGGGAAPRPRAPGL